MEIVTNRAVLFREQVKAGADLLPENLIPNPHGQATGYRFEATLSEHEGGPVDLLMLVRGSGATERVKVGALHPGERLSVTFRAPARAGKVDLAYNAALGAACKIALLVVDEVRTS